MKSDSPIRDISVALLEHRLHRLRQRHQDRSLRRHRVPGIARAGVSKWSDISAAKRARATLSAITSTSTSVDTNTSSDFFKQRTPVVRNRVPAVAQASRTFDFLHGSAAVIEDPVCGLRRLERDPSSLVIAISEACADNGLSNARASYGVFFATHTTTLNLSGLVPASSPQTSQYAELYATIAALDAIHQLIIAGEDLSQVILKTDSAYLKQGLSDFVWKWMRNGYRNWRGQPVVNGRAFRYLHERLVLLERDYATRVSFCLVAKEFNDKADVLAQRALRDEEVR